MIHSMFLGQRRYLCGRSKLSRGYAQIWRLQCSEICLLPCRSRLRILASKHQGVQTSCPTPIHRRGESVPRLSSGFEYRTSGGASTRESGEVQLRRRLRAGFTATLDYTFSKSIDDDAFLGGQGHIEAGSPSEASGESAAPTAQSGAIAQNWLNLRAERALSTFDQRYLLNVQRNILRPGSR